eukprot:GHRR01013888.1.p1 GENE.GHRR01013888.1~~GHRR01013888.1.p1  ORF type:complete len:235 (+),score=93.24 GHRR01013888.1:654-1358(+)
MWMGVMQLLHHNTVYCVQCLLLPYLLGLLLRFVPTIHTHRPAKIWTARLPTLLPSLVAFVSGLLLLSLRFCLQKREPLAGIEVVQLCSASSGPEQQQLQGQLHKVDGTGRDSTDSGAVDAAQQLTMCQQWQCRRWDGEVTAAELNNSQGQAALLYACVVFLGCRALWWWWQQCQRRKAAAAAPTPEPAAATTGSSESSSSSSSTLSAAEPPDTQAAAGEARPVIDRQPCSHGSS